MNERSCYSGRLGAKMKGGLGIPHHLQEKIERGQIRPFRTDHYVIAGFGCQLNPGIRIGVPFAVVIGDLIPICFGRALCGVTTRKLLVNERQYCLSCCEAIT